MANGMTLSTPAEGMPPRVGVVGPGEASSIPTAPPSDTIYQHHAQLKPSLKALWASRDIVYTLAERDIRAQYKQATLGLLWALIAPLLHRRLPSDAGVAVSGHAVK